MDSDDISKNPAFSKKNVSKVVAAVEKALNPLYVYFPRDKKVLDKLLHNVSIRMLTCHVDDICTPVSKVAWIIVQNYIISQEDQYWCDLYATFLAAAIDKPTQPMASPSMAHILVQLSYDESKILSLFVDPKFTAPVIDIVNHSVKKEQGGVGLINNFSSIADKAKCLYPVLVDSYIDNLLRLGLVELGERYADENQYKELEEYPLVVETVAKINQQAGRKAIINKKSLRLLSLGMIFIQLIYFTHHETRSKIVQAMTQYKEHLDDTKV